MESHVKIGDLVKFKDEVNDGTYAARGLVVEIKDSIDRNYGVLWDFLRGEVGWQYCCEIEVISKRGAK
ncbi:MAG: hypothetical protein CML56_08600 [Rhodobacteraceae bacterium]|nr:hypothetical protein [Paracoccaceae bacterium]|tara:strand:- start:153 stop:356 length:204 start_codon:yes stop_codon:yes gene_type:complete